MARKRETEFDLPSLDDMFSTQDQRDEAKLKKIYEIPLEDIDSFPDHPFKVLDDEDMFDLVESVKEYGIITPATVRKKEDGRYEILSGHRRKRACELAGLDTLRAEIVEMDRDSSIIFMVDCYSLEGAEFGVYKGDTKVATLTSKADGTSNTVELEAGTYTVKELKVPKGYAKEPDKNITVKAGVLNTVTFVDQPKDDPIGILLEKGDAETGKAKPQGGASLAGAVYEIKFYKHTDNGKSLARTWRVVTDKNGIARLTEGNLDPSFDNDEFYYSAAGDPCFPLGTVTIQEVKAPTGYMLNNKIYTREIKAGTGTTESVYSFNAPEIGSDVEVAEQIKRGDLEFVKVEDGTLNRLAGVPFKITSLTTGESHIIVTDRNGYASTASSWTKHTANTNRGQTSSDGIWFGDSEPDNSKGALPYDDYMLEEQSCKANEGMNLLKFKVSIYRDAVAVPLGTLTDDKIEIGTTADL